jgi:hypothetical protein
MTNQSNGTSNATIYPLGTNGFVRQAYTKNDKDGYRLEAYDNTLNESWVVGSDEKSKLVEGADIIYASQDYTGLNVMRKKNRSSREYDLFFQLVDSKKGTVLFEKPLKDNGADLSLLTCFVDEPSKSIIIGGEYYPPGEDQGKSKSQGMYMTSIDFTGTQKALKKLSWAMDFAKMKTPEDEAKSKKNMSIYFHNIFRSKDGNLVAIGEQYKKQVSGLGMASNILAAAGGGSTNQSAFSIFIYNMVVIEFDKDFGIKNITTVEKKKGEVEMPQGAAYYSAAYLAKFVDAIGGFDYYFTARDVAKDTYTSVYIDRNRKDDEGKKNDIMLGVINFKDGKVSTDRVPLNTEGTYIWYSPAKTGYIAVSEYFRKKKQIIVHLEKINY